MQKSRHLTGLTLRDIRDGTEVGDINAVIERNGDAPGWHPPEDMHVDGFPDHLVHQGPLQKKRIKPITTRLSAFSGF